MARSLGVERMVHVWCVDDGCVRGARGAVSSGRGGYQNPGVRDVGGRSWEDRLERFGVLCRYLGARSVAENLGVDEEFVARVLAGEEALEEHHVGELEDLFYLVRDVVGGAAGSGEPVARGSRWCPSLTGPVRGSGVLVLRRLLPRPMRRAARRRGGRCGCGCGAERQRSFRGWGAWY